MRSATSRVLLWTDESDFSVPDTTRNIVMRPANGSAIVFQTNAETGALASAGRDVSSPSAPTKWKGRSAGEGSVVMTASSNCGMPMFSAADVQTTGNNVPAAVADVRPASNSSSVRVPASK